MAEPSKDTEQSMEDILQSIKRIIADESDPAPVVAGSEVLELTELLAEDAAIPEPVIPEPVEPEPAVVATMSIDELMAAPMSSMPQEPATPEPVYEAPAPVIMVPVEPQPEPAPHHAAIDSDRLISDATLAASVSALHALANKQSTAARMGDSAVFRSGTTVEDLVVESLKPMLKEWLDGHLPSLVRTLVEKEIRRLNAS
jgi:cell pole-organizing protein PopZ